MIFLWFNELFNFQNPCSSLTNLHNPQSGKPWSTQSWHIGIAKRSRERHSWPGIPLWSSQPAFSRWLYAVLHALYHNTRLGTCTAQHATRSQQEWWRRWLWCVQSGRPRQLIVFDAAADHWGQVSGCVLKEATFSSGELARTIALPLKWAHWSPLEESGV